MASSSNAHTIVISKDNIELIGDSKHWVTEIGQISEGCLYYDREAAKLQYLVQSRHWQLCYYSDRDNSFIVSQPHSLQVRCRRCPAHNSRSSESGDNY